MKTIQLTRGYEVMVDDADYDDLMQYKWRVMLAPNTQYAVRTEWLIGQGKGNTIYMHRYLTGYTKNVDHIDRNGLNCQRHNMRQATVSENGRNCEQPRGKSGYRGVTALRKKWRSQIVVNNVHVSISVNDTPYEAAQCYNLYAMAHHGEFATINKYVIT